MAYKVSVITHQLILLHNFSSDVFVKKLRFHSHITEDVPKSVDTWLQINRFPHFLLLISGLMSEL